MKGRVSAEGFKASRGWWKPGMKPAWKNIPEHPTEVAVGLDGAIPL